MMNKMKTTVLLLAAMVLSVTQASAKRKCDTPGSCDFPIMDQLRDNVAALGAGAPAGAEIAAPTAATSDRTSLQDLLREQGISARSGENAYDALLSLFNKAQAPSQQDLAGAFSGQVFEKIDPDQPSLYGIEGKSVAGTLSSKFELTFADQNPRPKDYSLPKADIALEGLVPDFDDPNTEPFRFGGSEAKVKYLPGNILGAFMAPIYMELKVRKAGSCLVAEVGAHHDLPSFEKPDWVGYFCRQ